MNIQSIDSGTSSYAVGSVSTMSGNSTAAAPAANGEGGGGASVRLSGRGRLMAKLQALEESDPAKAKDVLASLAKTVRDKAGQASGEDAQRLGALADKLDQAAQTGDLSGLAPSKGSAPPPEASAGDAGAGSSAKAAYGHHHHHHAQAGSALMDQLNQEVDQLTASTPATTGVPTPDDAG